MNLQEIHEVFDAMMENDSTWMDAAEESARFYTGSYGTGHWEEDDLQTFNSEYFANALMHF